MQQAKRTYTTEETYKAQTIN